MYYIQAIDEHNSTYFLSKVDDYYYLLNKHNYSNLYSSNLELVKFSSINSAFDLITRLRKKDPTLNLTLQLKNNNFNFSVFGEE